MTALEQNLLSMLEATAYDLWRAALKATNNTTGQKLYERMNDPQIGDTVMETTSCLRLAGTDRMGLGKLIEKKRGETEYQTEWILQTPDGRTCSWKNAHMIALPLGEFDFYA